MDDRLVHPKVFAFYIGQKLGSWPKKLVLDGSCHWSIKWLVPVSAENDAHASWSNMLTFFLTWFEFLILEDRSDLFFLFFDNDNVVEKGEFRTLPFLVVARNQTLYNVLFTLLFLGMWNQGVITIFYLVLSSSLFKEFGE